MSKSKKSDKTRTSDAAPAINLDYLTEKFYEINDSENVVNSIVSEILESGFKKMYKIYLDRQLIPFAIHAVSQAILELTAWNFLEIEVFDEHISEDEGMDSLPVHTWSQGAISKRSASEFVDELQKTVIFNRNAATKEKNVKPIIEENEVRKQTAPKHLKLKKPKTQELPSRPPIQEREYIPGWSQRLEGFTYKTYTGQLKRPPSFSETSRQKKASSNFNTKNCSITSVFSDPILLWKRKLSKSAMFDENSQMLATLSLMTDSPCSKEALTAGSEEEQFEDEVISTKHELFKFRRQTHGVHIDWSVSPSQTVCKQSNNAKGTVQNPFKSKLRQLPTNKQFSNACSSDEEVLADQMQLNVGVTLQDGNKVYSGPQITACSVPILKEEIFPVKCSQPDVD